MMTSGGQREEPAPKSNFRSSYYEKVGFRGVDERKALQAILSQNPVNIDKLTLFVLKCSSLPESCRLLVWKLVLGKFPRSFLFKYPQENRLKIK